MPADVPGPAPGAAGLPTRAVLDTNVLISAALLPQSVSARLLQQVLVQSRLVFSQATFAELETRLWKPTFDRYITLDTRRLLANLSAVAEWAVKLIKKLHEVSMHETKSPPAFAWRACSLRGGSAQYISGTYISCGTGPRM